MVVNTHDDYSEDVDCVDDNEAVFADESQDTLRVQTDADRHLNGSMSSS